MDRLKLGALAMEGGYGIEEIKVFMRRPWALQQAPPAVYMY
jgi:hypothetical protein